MKEALARELSAVLTASGAVPWTLAGYHCYKVMSKRPSADALKVGAGAVWARLSKSSIDSYTLHTQ